MSGRRLGMKPILVLVAVFLLGSAAGASVTWAVAVRDLGAKFRGPPHKARAKFRVESMRRHLDLTDEQATEIEAILEKLYEDKEGALGDCRPKLDALRARVRKEIDAVLTPEQQTEYAEMRRRWRERKGLPPRATASSP